MYNPLDIYTALIGVKSGLMNAVTPELRAVTIDFDPKINRYPLCFFYDGEISEHTRALAELADTDTDCPHYSTDFHLIRLDFPQPIPVRGKFAYLRKEENLPVIKKESHAFLLQTTRAIVVFALDMQQALLGKITPTLRSVCVGVDTDLKLLEAFLVYDGPISKEDSDLAHAVFQEAPISFPDYVMNFSIKRVDPPVASHEAYTFSSPEKMGVYWRHERDW